MKLAKRLWHTGGDRWPEWFWTIGTVSLYRIDLGAMVGVNLFYDPHIRLNISLLFFHFELMIRLARRELDDE